MSISDATTTPPSDQPVRANSNNSVLVAEDDRIFRRILQDWLQKWNYQVVLAEDGTTAWNMLQQEISPGLLILDWMMPGIDGTDLCRRIRQRNRVPYQYILLVTSRTDSRDVVEGLDAGADDYLTKPFEKNELRARLRVGQRILTLQDDLIQAREELRFQATHDVLTNIWNRGALLTQLHHELDRARRFKDETGILMLDIDHFKHINDTYGHPIGDIVLQEASQRISQAVRSYDLVGRYGGEEFLVVLPICNKEQAVQSAERIRLAFAGRPFLADGSEIPVTVSIGATAAPPDLTSEKEILAIADVALYQAKHMGRNCTAVG